MLQVVIAVVRQAQADNLAPPVLCQAPACRDGAASLLGAWACPGRSSSAVLAQVSLSCPVRSCKQPRLSCCVFCAGKRDSAGVSPRQHSSWGLTGGAVVFQPGQRVARRVATLAARSSTFLSGCWRADIGGRGVRAADAYAALCVHQHTLRLLRILFCGPENEVVGVRGLLVNKRLPPAHGVRRSCRPSPALWRQSKTTAHGAGMYVCAAESSSLWSLHQRPEAPCCTL